MYLKLIGNDIKKSKLTTAAITVFIFLAALLAAIVVSLIINLFSAIDSLVIVTKAPSFVLMHTGDVDADAIKAFAEADGNVEDYQVSGFSNIEGAEITIAGNTLADSIQDNGVTAQNDRFDFLVNLDGEPVYPSNGEIYVPVFYMREFQLEPGGTVTLYGMPFTIAGFVRDSFMNPAMISSKRFVVSPDDYAKLEPLGATEQLISFRLKAGTDTANFNTDYVNAGLPANGPPPITSALVQMGNALTDGIMIAILLLVGALVVAVTFLCLRFTLLAKVEDDYKEIGVLKAIGLRVTEIKKLYMAKYGVMAAAACLLGFLASIPLSGLFMENIRVFIGQSSEMLLAALLGAAGAVLIFFAVMLYVNRVLRRFRHISASQAIRFGAPVERSKAQRGFKLSRSRLRDIDIFLGIKDVLSRKKLYVTMLLVLIVSTFIFIVPRNLYDTISSRNFVTNTGMGICDVIVGVGEGNDVPEKIAEITAAIAKDPAVAKYNVTYAYMFDAELDDGSMEKIIVRLGDHSVFPIKYTQGGMPLTETDIALSVLSAGDLGKNVGDQLTVFTKTGEKTVLNVCGIYSDITYGGKTSQAMFKTDHTDILNYSFPVLLANGGDAESMIARYENDFPYATVETVSRYTEQVFGGMTSSILTASYASAAVSVMLIFMITALFMRMLIAKDHYPIAVLKAGGFPTWAIQKQYITRSVTVLVLGVVIGTLLANTLGESVGVLLVSSSGASSFDFDINPLFAYLFSPAVVTACVALATWFGISGIKPLKVSEHIKES